MILQLEILSRYFSVDFRSYSCIVEEKLKNTSSGSYSTPLIRRCQQKFFHGLLQADSPPLDTGWTVSLQLDTIFHLKSGRKMAFGGGGNRNEGNSTQADRWLILTMKIRWRPGPVRFNQSLWAGFISGDCTKCLTERDPWRWGLRFESEH